MCGWADHMAPSGGQCRCINSRKAVTRHEPHDSFAQLVCGSVRDARLMQDDGKLSDRSSERSARMLGPLPHGHCPMLNLTPEEKRWRTVLENATVGVWNLTPQSGIVHYSHAWKAKLGFPSVDATDSTSFWRSRVHPDDFIPMLRALRLHLDGYTKTYEMRFRLRDGNFRYVAVKSRGRVVERDQHGIALRVVGTMV